MSQAIPDKGVKEGEVRVSKSSGREYKVLRFDPYTFINHDPTWFIQYVDDGKKYYRPQTLVLEDIVAR